MGAIAEAASRNDAKAMLTAMRDELARQLDDGVPARELASVSKRLMDIHKELVAIIAAEKQAETEKSGDAAEAW